MSCFAKPIVDCGGAYRGCEISQGPALDDLNTRRFTDKQVSEKACAEYCPEPLLLLPPPASPPAPSADSSETMFSTMKQARGISSPNGVAVTNPAVHKHLQLGQISKYTVHVVTGLCTLHDAMSSKGLDNLTVKPDVEGQGDFFVRVTEDGVKALISDQSLVLPLLSFDFRVFRPSALMRLSGTKILWKMDRAMADMRLLLPTLSEAAVNALRQTEDGQWVICYKQSTNTHAVAAELRKAKVAMEKELENVVHPDGQSMLKNLAAVTHAQYKPESPSLSELIDRVGLANCETAAIASAHKLGGDSTLIATGTVTTNGYVDLTASNHAWNIIHTGDDAGSLASVDFTPLDVKTFANKQRDAKSFFHTAPISESVENVIFHIALGIIDEKRSSRGMIEAPTLKEMERMIEGTITGQRSELYEIVGELLNNVRFKELTDRVNYARVISAFDKNPVAEFTEYITRIRIKWIEKGCMEEGEKYETYHPNVVLKNVKMVKSSLSKYDKSNILVQGFLHKDIPLLEQLCEFGFNMSEIRIYYLAKDPVFFQTYANKFNIDLTKVFLDEYRNRGWSLEDPEVDFLKKNGVFENEDAKKILQKIPYYEYF